jgi:hypothetical protein
MLSACANVFVARLAGGDRGRADQLRSRSGLDRCVATRCTHSQRELDKHHKSLASPRLKALSGRRAHFAAESSTKRTEGIMKSSSNRNPTLTARSSMPAPHRTARPPRRPSSARSTRAEPARSAEAGPRHGGSSLSTLPPERHARLLSFAIFAVPRPELTALGFIEFPESIRTSEQGSARRVRVALDQVYRDCEIPNDRAGWDRSIRAGRGTKTHRARIIRASSGRKAVRPAKWANGGSQMKLWISLSRLRMVASTGRATGDRK